jgi:excisionase family DNA binding protein
VLTRLQGWKYGFESPFKADLYFITTRLFTGNKWGTANPVMVRDQDFGIVRLRAFGTYDFRIVDAPRFLKEVAGTDDHFRLDEFEGVMRSRIVSVFSEALATSKIPALDIATRQGELGAALLPIINPSMKEKYGIELATFVLENLSVPAEVEQAIDKRSGMSAIGNLNDFVKYQMAQGFEKGGTGAAGIGAEVAVGMAMVKDIVNQAGGTTPTRTWPEILTPADAAKVLGVSEVDVIASLEAGEMKGKRIGSLWRITRVQLDQFLQ